MGQEESRPTFDENTPPQRLESRSLSAVAKLIKDGKATKIVVMTGAGISTSAGIPDFRSPETGLYANLARLELPYPEAVFDISYFRDHPEPFYTLAHELYPGKFRPTITHSFIALLHDKGLLLKAFTQNIDCLEREAGVPDEMIVEAHGSFATQRCIECRVEFPHDLMQQAIQKKEVPRCVECSGLVKPDIVFFGEGLPPKFFHDRMVVPDADLVLVMGTSLQVQPFSSLPMLAAEGVPRLLINMDKVGGLGSRLDDVLLLGDCDEGIRKLATELGWLDELEEKWAKTALNPTLELAESTAEPPGKEDSKPRTKDEQLLDEVEKLTKEIDAVLNISQTPKESAPLADVEREQARQTKLGIEDGPQALSTVVASTSTEKTLPVPVDRITSETSEKKLDQNNPNHESPHTAGKPVL
jgi:NAD-dependent histone deacetylase SIR2